MKIKKSTIISLVILLVLSLAVVLLMIKRNAEEKNSSAEAGCSDEELSLFRGIVGEFVLNCFEGHESLSWHSSTQTIRQATRQVPEWTWRRHCLRKRSRCILISQKSRSYPIGSRLLRSSICRKRFWRKISRTWKTAASRFFSGDRSLGLRETGRQRSAAEAGRWDLCHFFPKQPVLRRFRGDGTGQGTA